MRSLCPLRRTPIDVSPAAIHAIMTLEKHHSVIEKDGFGGGGGSGGSDDEQDPLLIIIYKIFRPFHTSHTDTARESYNVM